MLWVRGWTIFTKNPAYKGCPGMFVQLPVVDSDALICWGVHPLSWAAVARDQSMALQLNCC